MLMLLPIFILAIASFKIYDYTLPFKQFWNLGLTGQTIALLFSALFMIVSTLLFFVINEQAKIISQRTTLPATVFVMLTAGLFYADATLQLLGAVVALLLGVMMLCRSYDEVAGNSANFDIGLFFCVTILFVPKFILLLPFGIIAILLFAKQTQKAIIAYLLGIATTYFLVDSSFYLLKNELFLWDYLKSHIVSGQLFNISHSNGILFYSLSLFLLLMIALFSMWTRPRSLTIAQRKTINSIVLFLLVGIFSFLFIPDSFDVGILFLIALPSSFIISIFLIYCRTKITANLYFFLLFLLSISGFFMNIYL